MVLVQFANGDNFYKVSFKRINPHVVELRGNQEVTSMQNTTGFKTYRECLIPNTNDEDDNILGTFSEYTTVYRVTEDSIQYSNDTSVWEPPKEPAYDVALMVQWDDANDADALRPESVVVTVNGTDEVTITAEDGWLVVLKNVPANKTIAITAAEVIEEYDVTFTDQCVTYYHEYVDPEPSIEERITDVEDAVIELYDLVLMATEGEE